MTDQRTGVMPDKRGWTWGGLAGPSCRRIGGTAMPPANPLSLIPSPAQVPARDPFHDTPPFSDPPYKSEEDLAEARKAEQEKIHEMSLDEAKARLTKLTFELMNADSKHIRPLTVLVQRMRVAVLLLQEAHSGMADPGTNRELNLLNKLVAGKGLDEMGDADAREEVQQRLRATEDRLQARGAEPGAAQRIVRVLSVVMNRPTPLKPEPVPDAPPPDPPAG